MEEYFDVVAEFNNITDKLEKALPKCEDTCIKSKQLGLSLLGNDPKEYERWNALFNMFAHRSFIDYIIERRRMYAVKYIAEKGKDYDRDTVANILGRGEDNAINQILPKLENAPSDITPRELSLKGDIYGIYKNPFSIMLGTKDNENEQDEGAKENSTEKNTEADSRIERINTHMRANGGSELITETAIYLVKRYKLLPWDEAIEFAREYVRYYYDNLDDDGQLTAEAIIADFSRKPDVLGLWLQKDCTIKEAVALSCNNKQGHLLDIDEIIKSGLKKDKNWRDVETVHADEISEYKENREKRNEGLVKQRLFFEANKPGVSFNEYYKYIEDYGSRTKLAGYDDYYKCRVEYEKQLKNLGSFEEFREKYEIYCRNGKGNLSYDEFYEFWDLYVNTESEESYESFRNGMREITLNFRKELSDYAEACHKIAVSDFKDLYPELRDRMKKKICYEMAEEGYYPNTSSLNDVSILINKYSNRDSHKDIIDSYYIYDNCVEKLIEGYDGFLIDYPEGTIKDYVLRYRIYDCCKHSITMNDYYQYYDYYLFKGGTDNLRDFDHHVCEYCITGYSLITNRPGTLELKTKRIFGEYYDEKIEDLTQREEYGLFKDLYEKAKTDERYQDYFPFNFYMNYDPETLEEKKRLIYQSAHLNSNFYDLDDEPDDEEWD